MELQFTPMKHHGTTRVYLANGIGGFDVSGCPQPEALAETIVRACNAHEQLVAALREVLKHEEWHAASADEVTDEARAAIKQARAALAAAGAA